MTLDDPTDFDSLWDYGRLAETEARFRALLPATAADPSLHAELLTQIARAQHGDRAEGFRNDPRLGAERGQIGHRCFGENVWDWLKPPERRHSMAEQGAKRRAQTIESIP